MAIDKKKEMFENDKLIGAVFFHRANTQNLFTQFENILQDEIIIIGLDGLAAQNGNSVIIVLKIVYFPR